MPSYSTRQELFYGITIKNISGKREGNKQKKTIKSEMTESDTSPARASG
jgi:hypothetical protein